VPIFSRFALSGSAALCDVPGGAPYRRKRAVSREALLLVSALSLAGCSGTGASSFELFGAFFPAWMFCSLFGILAAIVARAGFVVTGLADVLPYQLFVCTAVGTVGGILAWLLTFAR